MSNFYNNEEDVLEIPSDEMFKRQPNFKLETMQPLILPPFLPSLLNPQIQQTQFLPTLLTKPTQSTQPPPPVNSLPPPPPPPSRKHRENQPIASCEIADFLNSESTPKEKKSKLRKLDDCKHEHETRKNALLNDIRTYRALIKEAQKQIKKIDSEIEKSICDINKLLDE
jgi:hypothetical protein